MRTRPAESLWPGLAGEAFRTPALGPAVRTRNPPPLGLRSAGLTPGHRLFPMRNLTPAFPFLY